MSKYLYKILSEKSGVKEGYIDSTSAKKAKKKLSQDGNIIISLVNTQPRFWQKGLSLPGAKLSTSEKINFFHNLYTMSSAGVSIVETLEIAADQINIKKAIKAVTIPIANKLFVTKLVIENNI
ncbi:hypothetical protein ACFLYY_02220 [Patescibacteria group bacterium]